MAGNSTVLREYLLSLGFQVNSSEQKKFDLTLTKTTKLATLAGGALVGVATAATAMVQTFSNQMEKLYYASRRTGSTVENLQALESSAKRIGLSGGQIDSAIEGMARSLRTNPGLTGLLKNLGVRVEGRDTSDVMKDMVRQLRQLPFYIGSKFASMFGMDEQTFLMMSQGLDKMEEAAERRKKLNADAGLNVEQAAAAAVEWNNSMRDIDDKFEVLKGTLSIALLPAMREVRDVTSMVLDDWIKIFKEWKGFDDFKSRLWEGITGQRSSAASSSQTAAGGLGAIQVAPGTGGRLMQSLGDMIRDYGHPSGWSRNMRDHNGLVRSFQPQGGGASAGGGEPQALLRQLEEVWDLPDGVLDSLWAQESGRGRDMLSPTGVRGHFQLTRPIMKQYGVNDPNDFPSEANGAAMYFHDLLQQYKGNVPNALAHWNGGGVAGNNLALGSQETQNFVPQVLHRMEQHNTVIVNGAGDPKAVAGNVVSKLGDATRNAKGAIE